MGGTVLLARPLSLLGTIALARLLDSGPTLAR